jgi:hypothetical protein
MLGACICVCVEVGWGGVLGMDRLLVCLHQGCVCCECGKIAVLDSLRCLEAATLQCE